jgi:hypothetical protein
VADELPLPDADDVVRCAQNKCPLSPMWAEYVFLAPNDRKLIRLRFLCTPHKLEAEEDGDLHERLRVIHQDLLRRLNGGARMPDPSRVFFVIHPWG